MRVSASFAIRFCFPVGLLKIAYAKVAKNLKLTMTVTHSRIAISFYLLNDEIVSSL